MLKNQRHLFDIPDDVAYFNCGYMSPLTKAATEAGLDGIRRKSNPWVIPQTDFFRESLRVKELFGQLINSTSDNISIIPSASYGLSIAARNLSIEQGEKILVLKDQFPSNIYCWQEVTKQTGAEILTVEEPADRDWTAAVLNAIDETVAIAALPNNHWADGGLLDLPVIGEKLRNVGAKLVLDVTQSLGAYPLDIEEVQPDFMIAAAYKWLLGPYSVGMMYVAPEHHDGQPIEYNWLNRLGSEDFSRLVDYQDEYQPGAFRFDMGERANFAILPVAISALEQLLEWGVANISEKLGAINNAIAEQAREIGFTSIAPHLRAPHFLGLEKEGGIPKDLLPNLASENIFVSQRGNSLRITPHVFISDHDCTRLLDALKNYTGK